MNKLIAIVASKPNDFFSEIIFKTDKKDK